MSGSHSFTRRTGKANRWQSWGGSPLARAVQEARSIVVTVTFLALCAMLMACVIPPSLDEEAPGVNSPPAITGVRATDELAEPGPYSVPAGPMAGTLSVSLLDTNVNDSLFLRIFLDYNTPVGNRLPPRVACPVPQSNTPARMATCDLAGLCLSTEVGTQHNMSIVVFDRPPLDFGPNPQGMNGIGGMSTDRFYFVRCVAP
jgi:hypothetical protein